MTDTNPLRARFRSPGVKWATGDLIPRIRTQETVTGTRRVITLNVHLPNDVRAAVELRPNNARELAHTILAMLQETAP